MVSVNDRGAFVYWPKPGCAYVTRNGGRRVVAAVWSNGVVFRGHIENAARCPSATQFVKQYTEAAA